VRGNIVALSFNPSDPNMLVASVRDGSIVVWDVGTKESKYLTGTSGVAYQVAFTNDGNSIAAARVIRTWPTQSITKAPTPARARGPRLLGRL
jgi:WD40 repeat protein